MAQRVDCYPWFHAEFAPLVGKADGKIDSGCVVNAQGNVPCEPEALRADAERKMLALGWNKRLTLEMYTLARYMQGEVGSGTVEERVAVGEAAVNRAKRERLPQGVLSLLLYRQQPSHPNYGWYGPIHGVGSGVSTAPYGRWATTGKDPSMLTIMLAELVMTGKTANFSRGAEDQDGPEHWASMGQETLNNYVRREASKGHYWVGPLPGVDHWRTFLQFYPGISVETPQGQALLARGLEALTLPKRSPQWPPNLPVCGKPIGNFWITAALGIVGGAWWFSRKRGKS